MSNVSITTLPASQNQNIEAVMLTKFETSKINGGKRQVSGSAKIKGGYSQEGGGYIGAEVGINF